ncbi:MAG: Yip1 family protein [Giesbergeria sp.]
MNVVERAKSILLSPKPTWETIDTEPADAAGLYTRYLMLLAVIPAVCGFIGMSIVGMGAFGVSFRVPFLSGLVNMVVSYVLSLVGVFVLSLIINALAPKFGGTANQLQALKVAVYSSTAALLGGVFTLLPTLAMLGLVASLYSIYLLYTGLPVLMKSNREKSGAYTALVILAAIVLGLIVGAVSAMITPRGASPFAAGDGAAISVRTPGGEITIDGAGIAAAQRKMEEAGRSMEQARAKNDPTAMAAATRDATAAATEMLGGGQALGAQVLKAALPEKLGDLARTAFEVQDGAALGLPTSQATAQYGSGERTVRVEIVDLGGLGAMAAAAFGMAQGEKEDQSHAEKTWQEGGRTLHESYAKDGSSAERKLALKNGVLVSVSADHMDIAALRSLADQIDISALERLERKSQ